MKATRHEESCQAFVAIAQRHRRENSFPVVWPTFLLAKQHSSKTMRSLNNDLFDHWPQQPAGTHDMIEGHFASLPAEGFRGLGIMRV